ncbi:MAG: VWA domain-containing protein [Pyrinomonadaceae bacterium]
MSNLAKFAFIFLLFSFPAFSQDTPVVSPDDIVKIDTSLIQLDVSVTDSKGVPIKNIKPEEFEVYENGVRQQISNVSFVNAIETNSSNKKGKSNVDETVPMPNYERVTASMVHRTFAIIVDDLSLSFESMYYARRTLQNFVKNQMQEGDLVAIIRTGGGMGTFQQFTFNKRQLIAAIDSLKWNPLGSGGISTFEPIEANPLEIAQAAGDDIDDEDVDAENARQDYLKQTRNENIAFGALEAISFVLRGMSELPGRKSILLFSDGFSLSSKDELGFMESSPVMGRIEKIIDQAARFGVVIYGVDPRGLQYTGLTAADNTGSITGERLAARVSNRGTQLYDSQAGLKFLAENTGGFAVINNNDLNGAVRRVMEDQSYYLVSYEPAEDSFDPAKNKFNKIEIKVSRKDATVRYRSGYFAVTENKPAEQNQKPSSPEQTLYKALSSPLANNDIKLSLNNIFLSPKKNELQLKSIVHIDVNDLTITKLPTGKNEISFDILAVTFGVDGIPVESIGKTYKITVPDSEIEGFRKKGIVYYLNFPIKKAGSYQFRVAVRDQESNKTGSANNFIEIPKLSNRRLALSGIAFENFTYEQWNEFQKTGLKTGLSNALQDSSQKRFPRGSILTYVFEIYNSTTGARESGDLQVLTKMFKDNKLVHSGAPQSVPANRDIEKGVSVNGALRLGKEIAPGNYILQIIVTDNKGKRNRNVAASAIDFEVY